MFSNADDRAVSRERNLLEMTPVAIHPASGAEDGSLRVKVPKFRNIIWRYFCRIFMLGETIDVRLDDISGFIYVRCDGNRTVGNIMEEAGREFGERIEPAAPRLREFFRILERNGLIRFEEDGNKAQQ
jgi:hypothetical protein